MRRVLRVPLERWEVELLVEPHRPLLEAEVLVLAAAQGGRTLADLTAGASSPPWAVLNALVDDGLLAVAADGSLALPATLRDAAPERLAAAISGAGAVRRVRATVYRDLCGGAWLAARSVAEAPAPSPDDELHELTARVTAGAPDARIESVEGLIRASLPSLRRLKSGAPRTLARRTRVERVARIERCTVDVAFERTELSDGWEHWLTGADAALAEVCVRAAPQLVLGRKTVAAGVGRWDRGPEIACLQQCEVVARHLWHRRKERDLTTDTRLLEEIKQIVHGGRASIAALRAEASTLRADAARVVTGTGFDQALELADVLRRTRSRALLLSSFLSPEFAGDVAARVEASLPPGAHLRCVYGRANDDGIAAARTEADAYAARLRAEGLTRAVTVVPSAVRTHAKVVVNDAGDVWLGSWNALSAAPGSAVTEVGVRLGGADVALAVLSALDETFDEATRAYADEMRRVLEPARRTWALRAGPLAEVEAALDWIERWVPRRLDQQWDQRLEERLQTVREWFCDVTERPRVALVATNEHRDAMLSWVRQADHGVLLATDRIKPAGLDPQLTAALAEQPMKVEQKVRFELRLLWGREPSDRAPEHADAARAQLALLDAAIRRARAAARPTRSAPGARPTGFAFDLYTDLARPMRNHAKVLQVDDERLLVTSDNLLVYGDERAATDARELGVAVEAPRQALVLRGELELSHAELRARWDHTRWRVAYAESVRFCAGLDGTAAVAAGRAAQDMIGRCLGRDGAVDRGLDDDMRSRLFETGNGCQRPADALVRLLDIASRNRLIDFDRAAYQRVRREARQRDVSTDVSELLVRLPDAARVWEERDHVEGRTG